MLSPAGPAGTRGFVASKGGRSGSLYESRVGRGRAAWARRGRRPERLCQGARKNTTHHAITGRPAIIKNTISSNWDARPNERGSRTPTDIRAKTMTPPKRQAQTDNRILLLMTSYVGTIITTGFGIFQCVCIDNFLFSQRPSHGGFRRAATPVARRNSGSPMPIQGIQRAMALLRRWVPGRPPRPRRASARAARPTRPAGGHPWRSAVPPWSRCRGRGRRRLPVAGKRT